MSKCGCLYCRKRPIPTTRAGWSGIKNRNGFYYGTTKKNTKGSKPKAQRM